MTRQGIDQGCCYPWWEKVFYSSFNDLQKLRLQNLDSAVTCTVLCSQWRSLPLPLPLCQAPSHWLCTNARFHSSLGSLNWGFIHRRWLFSCIVPSSFMVHISDHESQGGDSAGCSLIWMVSAHVLHILLVLPSLGWFILTVQNQQCSIFPRVFSVWSWLISWFIH